MIAVIKRFAREAAAPVEQMGERLLKKSALLALSVTCLFFASVFLTIALYIVQTLEESVIAAFGVALSISAPGSIAWSPVAHPRRRAARRKSPRNERPAESLPRIRHEY